jgi:plasmid stabilization system protein ParE
MRSGFALHPQALDDLEEIRDFLAQRNLDHADRVISGIFDAVRDVVVPFPHAGRIRMDLTSRPLRFYVALDT